MNQQHSFYPSENATVKKMNDALALVRSLEHQIPSEGNGCFETALDQFIVRLAREIVNVRGLRGLRLLNCDLHYSCKQIEQMGIDTKEYYGSFTDADSQKSILELESMIPRPDRDKSISWLNKITLMCVDLSDNQSQIASFLDTFRKLDEVYSGEIVQCLYDNGPVATRLCSPAALLISSGLQWEDVVKHPDLSQSECLGSETIDIAVKIKSKCGYKYYVSIEQAECGCKTGDIREVVRLYASLNQCDVYEAFETLFTRKGYQALRFRAVTEYIVNAMENAGLVITILELE